jgi:hypothetical protein
MAKTALRGSIMTVLLATLPWLAVAFKALSCESAEIATDALLKIADN